MPSSVSQHYSRQKPPCQSFLFSLYHRFFDDLLSAVFTHKLSPCCSISCRKVYLDPTFTYRRTGRSKGNEDTKFVIVHLFFSASNITGVLCNFSSKVSCNMHLCTHVYQHTHTRTHTNTHRNGGICPMSLSLAS